MKLRLLMDKKNVLKFNTSTDGVENLDTSDIFKEVNKITRLFGRNEGE